MAAARDIPQGAILQPADLVTEPWPATMPMGGTYDKPEVLIGRSVLYPLEKGQPITDKLLSSPGAGVGLAGEISPGMRALALRSDEVMGVAGFLLPGSRVDVLVTYKADNSPESQTFTVLQNVEVLAAGQKTQPDPQGAPVTATVVTLLLTPEDAQLAVLASTQGSIHFLLRNGVDKEHTDKAPVALSQLWTKAGAKPAPAKPTHSPAAIAKPSRSTIAVETVSGGKVTSRSFDRPQP